MHDELNPFLDLPKPPTLPPTYTSLPSTLPPSILSSSAPTTSHPDPNLPAYVTSSSGFAAHPSTITTQNRALLKQIQRQREEGERKVREWEEGIREVELREKRRRAPGWLDSEQHLLQPEKKGEERGGGGGGGGVGNLMDDGVAGEKDGGLEVGRGGGGGMVGRDDEGAEMDRVFGRSEMG
ncbi:hypothetical protein LTR86_003818 [Recurvomyces mirabilis]|nr:hypothetical protein LTR86_003818 [Recurvomyces mirabilis]